MRKVIVNTTPLIALSHVGHLEFLKKLYGEVIIPDLWSVRKSILFC